MRLILARHGETAGNRERLALGRLDVPLNDTGCLQARALAASLQRAPLAAVYSSPLRRALETAEAIAAPHSLEVCIEEGLAEMDIGEMDGHSIEEMQKLHGDFLRRWFTSEAATLRMPGGECLEDVRQRCCESLARILERHPEDTVCAVSHNFTIHVLLCHALGLPLSEFRRLRHDLAAVSVLDYRGEHVALVRLNDTCHLDEAGLSERPLY